ncbi:MAG: Rieske (2Fe-2S) protein [Flavobacteriales bacterium]|nr:Rieske (2Fe-2S) protein [Flavobacteriales bacterium]MCB0793598.1 Rieske (2Fe-2S) protein [Flavobacteriales bacterium]
MERRRFLLTGCKACAALAVVPSVLALESCGSTKGLALAVVNGAVSVPLSEMGDGRTMVVKAKGLSDDVLLVKQDDGSYSALSLKCPHKGGPVKPQGNELVCGWHSSNFDMMGKVQKGPAKTDLTSYPVQVDGGTATIQVG